MIETKNKHSLLYQCGTVSKEVSCVLISQMPFGHRKKEQQVSDQSQELNVNNARGLYMNAQLRALYMNAQLRASKIILGSNYKNYEESLSELSLPTLDERRHETLMKFGADILKSPTHRDILPQFTSVTHAHKTRVATFKEGKELLECPPTH